MRWIFRLLVLGALGYGAWYAYGWYHQDAGRRAIEYRTATVTRGDVLVTINATGTIEPEEVVDVGAQVAGQITEFGKDVKGHAIDYGSEIVQDQVLAVIDDSVYRADVRSSTAQLDQSKASVARAKADLEQLKARLRQAEADWRRAEQLDQPDLLTKAEVDGYRATWEAAQAAVGVGEASIVQAESAVSQSEASLFRAQRNLGFCVIKSPVTGIIIDRRVNIGQTVVASLNAPSLFLIAKDLKRMEVWVAVNEADIGQVRVDQPVTFTVDAFSGDVFSGKVQKVRLNAAMTQNVVTYTVEVITDNASGRLLPYLTANVRFEVARRDDCLRVPNSALRFEPTLPQTAAETTVAGAPTQADASAPNAPPASQPVAAATEGEAGAASRPSEREGGREGGREGRRNWRRDRGQSGEIGGDSDGLASGGRSRGEGDSTSFGRVWVKDAAAPGGLRSIRVRTGLSDGSMTEILGDTLVEGAEIVVAEINPADAAAPSSPTTNPFQPANPFRNRGGGGGGGRRGP